MSVRTESPNAHQRTGSNWGAELSSHLGTGWSGAGRHLQKPTPGRESCHQPLPFRAAMASWPLPPGFASADEFLRPSTSFLTYSSSRMPMTRYSTFAGLSRKGARTRPPAQRQRRPFPSPVPPSAAVPPGMPAPQNAVPWYGCSRGQGRCDTARSAISCLASHTIRPAPAHRVLV